MAILLALLSAAAAIVSAALAHKNARIAERALENAREQTMEPVMPFVVLDGLRVVPANKGENHSKVVLTGYKNYGPGLALDVVLCASVGEPSAQVEVSAYYLHSRSQDPMRGVYKSPYMPPGPEHWMLHAMELGLPKEAGSTLVSASNGGQVKKVRVYFSDIYGRRFMTGLYWEGAGLPADTDSLQKRLSFTQVKSDDHIAAPTESSSSALREEQGGVVWVTAELPDFAAEEESTEHGPVDATSS